MINNAEELTGHIRYIQSHLKCASDTELNEIDIRVVASDIAWQVCIAMKGKFSHSFGIPPELMLEALFKSRHRLAREVSPYVSRVNAVSPMEAENFDDFDVESELPSVSERLQYIRNTIAYLAVYIVFTPKTEITIADGFWKQIDQEFSQFDA